MPNVSKQKPSSPASSARWVCSRTSSRSASSAVAVISSVDTENGEHGASAICTIAPGERSWNATTRRSESARIASSVCTVESGGSPPSLALSDIDPRVGWNRTPRSAAAATSAAIRSPPPAGCT